MKKIKRLKNAILILFLLITVGYISYIYSQHVGINARQKEAAHRLEVFSGALFTPMDKYDYLPEITSNNFLVVNALRHQTDPARTKKLNAYLEYLNKKARSEVIYVLDSSGMTIASSNWREPLSFVGQNYFFRPYFQDAIKGKEGRFYGVGIVSRLPGYFLSHQVRSNNQLLGVVVIKVDLGELDANWEEDKDIMVVTDENGIIFLSSRKDWKYRALGELDAKTIEHLESTKQYGHLLKSPIHIKHETRLDDNNRIVRIGEPNNSSAPPGKRYFVKSSVLQGSKWEVSIFSPLAETDTRSTQAAFAALAALTFMILLFLYFQETRKRRREKEASQNALQHAHQELEKKHRELESLNFHLQSQSKKLQLTVSEVERAKAEADSANLAKSEFLASMSHEIRTPMSAILGLTHLALKTELTAKQRNYLANVDGAATTLLGILNNILDFSKIEAGKLPIEHIAFDLHKIFNNISAILALSAEEKGVELIFRIDPSLSSELIGDPLRLGQVLLNLVSNAIKFTEQGEVLVSVESTSSAQNKIELRFSIKDTGIGISAQQICNLFQPFTQADQSTTRRYGGTGLGLAISKKLAEAMGGEIEVESILGQGSRFSFTVELEYRTESSVLIRESLPELSGVRVLVVDDNSTVRETLTSLLQACSMQVVSVASGAEAIEVLNEGLIRGEDTFDLILLDYKMPDADGMETANGIREIPSFRLRPNIVMMMPHGKDDSALRGGQTDINAFISKPIDPSALLASLLKAISNVAPKELCSPCDGALYNISDLKGLRVLVAEDNEINQQMVREILESSGIVCEIVSNGRDAVRSALKNSVNFDLILMDLEMPGMDGLDATRIIRKLAKYRIPIIALTAYAMEQDRKRCLEAGFDHHLTKPVNPETLIQEIARHVRSSIDGTTPPILAKNDGVADTQNTDAETPELEPPKVRRLIAEIDALLATNHLNAEDRVLRLRDILNGRGFDVSLDLLEKSVDQLDYRSARNILAGLAKDLVLANDARN